MRTIQFCIITYGIVLICVAQQVVFAKMKAFGDGNCKCNPTECGSCSSQEMSACGKMCSGGRRSLPEVNTFKRSSSTVSQLYGPWFLKTGFNRTHDVTCVQGEDVDVDGNSYQSVYFNVHEIMNPDQIIHDKSWHLMLNGNGLDLAPERVAWCEEQFGNPCPIDVWFDQEFVVGRYWEDGTIGNGTFEFVFEFTRDQFEE